MAACWGLMPHCSRALCCSAPPRPNQKKHIYIPHTFTHDLQLLPLYTLAVHKTVLATGLRADERAAAMSRVAWMPPAATIALVHPRLFEVHRLLEGPPVDPSGAGPMPPTLTLASERLDAAGVFLLENGVDALLWVGKLAPAELLAALLGVQSAEQIQGASFRLAPRDTPASARLHELLAAVRAQRKVRGGAGSGGKDGRSA